MGTLRYLFPDEEFALSCTWKNIAPDAIGDLPHTVDYSTVKRWIAECDVDHKRCEMIHQERSMRPIVKTYFIDTFDNCLILGNTGLRFLTLSYVWGNTVMFKTTFSQLHVLTKPGAFLNVEPPISTVIRDAIEASSNLGERYLWVDALCIAQDDGSEKTRLITQMDSIYAQAYLTIVASGGNNADAPLPGVRQGTRCNSGALVNLSAPLDGEKAPNRYFTVRPSLDSSLLDSSYATRGWTFQETSLSRRCLTFTPYSTFFHCDSMSICEPGTIQRHEQGPERSLLSSLFDKSGPKMDLNEQYDLYVNLVVSFSNKKLTYPGDSLQAISGIFGVLSKQYGWEFTFGMPLHLLDYAVLFRSTNALRWRNKNFPSWSWAGWSNQVHWNQHTFETCVIADSRMEGPRLVPLELDSEINIDPNVEELSGLNAQAEGKASQLHIVGFTAPVKKFEIRPAECFSKPPHEPHIVASRDMGALWVEMWHTFRRGGGHV